MKFFNFFVVTFSLVQVSVAATSSVYTDLKNDCIVVSSATEKAPIDFYSSECKAFGGYTLGESGSDLRYGPVLGYHGVDIDLQLPYSFHEMGSSKIEWVYDVNRDEEGFGSLVWKALIFRIESDVYSDEDGDEPKNVSNLHVVRLNGKNSCVIGLVKTNEAARELANKANAPCAPRSDY